MGSPGTNLSEPLLDVENLVKEITEAVAKSIPLEHVITQYAAKWFPELNGGAATPNGGSMAAWIKKRFLVETIIGLLPQEKDSLSCSFLLKLLRIGNLVGAEPSCLLKLENKVSRQLDQASLKDLMIPSFSHTSSTLLDVQLLLRLVRGFEAMDESLKSSAAISKVSKLLDGYLAEAAMDANLLPKDLAALAGALPAHARASDDGLYRAVDTFLKTHPGTSKEERREMWKMIDSRKLSSEAMVHAAQNERLPVRAVVEVLFSESKRLNRTGEWGGPLSGPKSPASSAAELPTRCPSKREVSVQQQEIRTLREDVSRLQLQCHTLQMQVERLLERKKRGGGGGMMFKWRTMLFKQIDVGDKIEDDVLSRHTPMLGKKGRQTLPIRTPTPKWRNSLS